MTEEDGLIIWAFLALALVGWSLMLDSWDGS